MNLRTLRKFFTKSPHTHRPMASWMWNGRHSTDELSDQADQILGGGMGGAMLMPEMTRSASAIDYMSEDWHESLLAVAKRARKKRDSIWIYDDWSDAPSPALEAFLQEHPEHCFTSLLMDVLPVTEKCIEEFASIPPLAIFAKEHPQHTYYDTYTHLPQMEKLRDRIGETVYVFRTKTHHSKLNVFNETSFNDYMQVTHAPCQQYTKKYYGNTIGLLLLGGARYVCAPGELPWDAELSAYFSETYGYSILPHLPDLFFDTEGATRVRYDFWTFIHALFQEGLVRPSATWGAEHDMPISGFFGPSTVDHQRQGPLGSAMSLHAHRQFPSLRLDNDYLDCLAHLTPDCAHQVVAIKEAVSVVRQMEKSGVINESLPVDATAADLSRLHTQIQVQIALGVKFFAYYACPDSFRSAVRSGIDTVISPMESRWPLYKKYFDSVSRVAWLLSLGRPICSVLLVHPGDSFHALHQHPSGASGSDDAHANPKDTLERHFALLSAVLLKNQIDYDYGDEELMSRHATAGHRTVHVGAQTYNTVIIPPSLTMRSSTLHVLQDFAMGGGKLYIVGSAPRLLDGKPSQELQDFIEEYATRIIDGVDYFNYDQVLEAIRRNAEGAPLMQADDGRQVSNIMMQHRVWEDMEILHMVHTGPSEYTAKLIWAPRKDGHIEIWDPHTGSMEPVRNCLTGQHIELPMSWQPNESRTYVVIPGEAKNLPEDPAPLKEERRIELDWAGTRAMPNILPLTTCQIGDGPWMSVADARQHIQSLLDLANGVTSVTVRWGTEWNEQAMPEAPINALVPKGDELAVTFDDTAVRPADEVWALDDGYASYPLGSVAGPENRLVTNMTLNNARDFQPIYLEGDFSVVPGKTHPWKVQRCDPTLGTTSWSESGLPFYPGKVTYRTEVTGYDRFGAGRVLLALPGLHGCAAIRINNTVVDNILYPPYECDITSYWKKGPLEIEVDVYGSLSNLIDATQRPSLTGLTAPPDIVLLTD